MHDLDQVCVCGHALRSHLCAVGQCFAADCRGSCPKFRPVKNKGEKRGKTAPQKRKNSLGEETLAFQLTAYKIGFVREYQFDAVRKWRFDFALPEHKLAIEVEGGIWTQGRHTRGSGYIKDLEKYNAAAAQGWKVLKFTTKQAKNGEAAQEILKNLFIKYKK